MLLPGNPINTQVTISACPERFQLSAAFPCRARAEHTAISNTWRAEIAFGTKDAGNSAVRLGFHNQNSYRWRAGSHSAGCSSHFLGPPGTSSVPVSRAVWTSGNLLLAWTLDRKWERSTRNAACPYSRSTETATFKPVFIWRRKQEHNKEYSVKTWKMLELL